MLRFTFPSPPSARAARGFRRALAAALLAGAVSAAPAPAADPAGADAEALAAIRSRIEATVVAGYRERDPAKVLSLYAADATVIGFVMGVGSPAKMRGFLDRDFAHNREVRVTLEELSLTSLEGAIATVRYRLPMQLISNDGRTSTVRNDWHYMKLRRGEGGWEAFLQSYRPDFGASEFPHGGKGGSSEDPHQAPAAPKGTTEL